MALIPFIPPLRGMAWKCKTLLKKQTTWLNSRWKSCNITINLTPFWLSQIWLLENLKDSLNILLYSLNEIWLLRRRNISNHYVPCEKLRKMSIKLAWLWNCSFQASREYFRFHANSCIKVLPSWFHLHSSTLNIMLLKNSMFRLEKKSRHQTPGEILVNMSVNLAWPCHCKKLAPRES